MTATTIELDAATVVVVNALERMWINGDGDDDDKDDDDGDNNDAAVPPVFFVEQ